MAWVHVLWAGDSCAMLLEKEVMDDDICYHLRSEMIYGLFYTYYRLTG